MINRIEKYCDGIEMAREYKTDQDELLDSCQAIICDQADLIAKLQEQIERKDEQISGMKQKMTKALEIVKKIKAGMLKRRNNG